MIINKQLSYQITYAGKEPEEFVIKNSTPADIQIVKSYGNATASTNSLIYGDNLPILKKLLLEPKVAGKVKLVYIDPPFATNQTFHGKKLQPAYADELSGAAYLEFMRKRLILMRELLAKDGSIYVHLDSNMAFEIKLIMDEVFGVSNFRNWITRKKSNRKNYTRKTYGNIQDFILFYTKSDNYIWNRPYKERGIYSLEERFPKVEKETGRRYALVPIHAPGIRNGATGSDWKGKKPPYGKHWMFKPEKLDEFNKKGEIYWSLTGNPRRKIYADNDNGVPIQDIWLDFKDAHNQNIAVTGYPTEKNIDLLKQIIEASTNKGDLVLDAFVGSGTTVAAANELNRKWIGIDNSKLAIYITLKRLLDIDKKNQQLVLGTLEAVDKSFTVCSSQNDPMVENGNHKPKVDIHLNGHKKQPVLEILDFQSNDPASIRHNDRRFDLLGMVILDSDYGGGIFNIKHAFPGEAFKKTKEIQVNQLRNSSKLGIVVYDIFGNELILTKVKRTT